MTEIIRDLHVYPDFHGNRSPIADAKMRGSIVGLTMDDSLSDLAKKYYATMEAVALQTRHIIDEMNTNGHCVKEIFMSGGQCKNLMLMQLLANACSMPVILPHSHSTAVILGSAVLGKYAASETATSSSDSHDLWQFMVAMTPPSILVPPKLDGREQRLLDVKYKIFQESFETQVRWRKEIEKALSAEDGEV